MPREFYACLFVCLCVHVCMCSALHALESVHSHDVSFEKLELDATERHQSFTSGVGPFLHMNRTRRSSSRGSSVISSESAHTCCTAGQCMGQREALIRLQTTRKPKHELMLGANLEAVVQLTARAGGRRRTVATL